MPSYGCRFPAMVADWRSKWSQGSLGQTGAEFPFGFVSLVNTTALASEPFWLGSVFTPSAVSQAPWKNPNNAPAGIRWAQTAGYGHVPNPAMPAVFDAIAIDLTVRPTPPSPPTPQARISERGR